MEKNLTVNLRAFAIATLVPVTMMIVAMWMKPLWRDEYFTQYFADPDQSLNKHRIIAQLADGSVFDEYCENIPDPANPKTSLGTADSLIAALTNPRDEAFTILTADNISFLDAAPT